ncbi:hypothetical protein FQN60_001805 [Etheostoma spectabile]|uniref:IRF tryptophan pentad repeat domain-containing protein n=1 Tax=Etheostoma spectabile TaxID=54343 RepID=A0A5J5D842_9PERO|nr:hypothetical protein FQN60_001805 [Etheostoma spectabile]
MEAKMHMKEWLIAQIDSGEYEGLLWEDDNKTMFRIPWKHAAKKDYKQTEDAALFKAWAVTRQVKGGGIKPPHHVGAPSSRASTRTTFPGVPPHQRAS